jgi:hypothetical protein
MFSIHVRICNRTGGRVDGLHRPIPPIDSRHMRVQRARIGKLDVHFKFRRPVTFSRRAGHYPNHRRHVGDVDVGGDRIADEPVVVRHAHGDRPGAWPVETRGRESRIGPHFVAALGVAPGVAEDAVVVQVPLVEHDRVAVRIGRPHAVQGNVTPFRACVRPVGIRYRFGVEDDRSVDDVRGDPRPAGVEPGIAHQRAAQLQVKWVVGIRGAKAQRVDLDRGQKAVGDAPAGVGSCT